MQTVEVLVLIFFALLFVKISIQMEFILVRLKTIDKHIIAFSKKRDAKLNDIQSSLNSAEPEEDPKPTEPE